MSDPRPADRTEVFYLTSAPSATQFAAMSASLKDGVQHTTYGMAEASFKFHNLLQRGLLADPTCHVHAVVGRSATPRFYRGRWWSRVLETHSPRHTVDHLGFPNVRGLKQAWLALAFTRQALAWRWRTRGAASRVLVADAAYITALPGVLRALAGDSITKIAIFADVYDFMAEVEDAGRGGHHRLRARMRSFAAATYAELDGFVLLTEQMNEVVNPRSRPYLVMEGLVDSTMRLAENSLEAKTAAFSMLYAGALRAEYGVADLVEGFRALSADEAELHIYGGGDYAPDVARAAAEDPRVRFHGRTDLDEVVAAEMRAWLLVNPRPTSEDFVKYSFPSKNMEYLASGTAVLTTRLPGMPTAYYDHVLTIDADGAPAITAALEKALAVPLTDLHRQGAAAREFVLAGKNERVQAARILELAKRCSR
ncbi:glycosyltransferase [Nocardioides sp.]|uniref:glycosyltransferase n=1 Tax=Nocardioides sp. TaxID=35761 RepID=UPI00286E58EE|nr:glycosyltransferase [Nocardioides sp.]